MALDGNFGKETKQMRILTGRPRREGRMPFQAGIFIQKRDTYTFTVDVQHILNSEAYIFTFRMKINKTVIRRRKLTTGPDEKGENEGKRPLILVMNWEF